MNGHVDSYGRALVTVSVRASDVAATHGIQVWIDTAFNGDLVLPQQQIDDLALLPSGTVKAILADGSEVALQRYTCLTDWFGEERDLEVVANDGGYPLLGVGLLLGRRLRADVGIARVGTLPLHGRTVGRPVMHGLFIEKANLRPFARRTSFDVALRETSVFAQRYRVTRCAEAKLDHIVSWYEARVKSANLLLNQVTGIVTEPDLCVRGATFNLDVEVRPTVVGFVGHFTGT